MAETARLRREVANLQAENEFRKSQCHVRRQATAPERFELMAQQKANYPAIMMALARRPRSGYRPGRHTEARLLSDVRVNRTSMSRSIFFMTTHRAGPMPQKPPLTFPMSVSTSIVRSWRGPHGTKDCKGCPPSHFRHLRQHYRIFETRHTQVRPGVVRSSLDRCHDLWETSMSFSSSSN